MNTSLKQNKKFNDVLWVENEKPNSESIQIKIIQNNDTYQLFKMKKIYNFNNNNNNRDRIDLWLCECDCVCECHCIVYTNDMFGIEIFVFK